MAGGEGSRLRPLTIERPKPMAMLGDAPVMEHILRLLRAHGFTDVIVTLHYLGSTIENYFQSGEDFGLRITYTYEDEPLGTAGSVALAREQLTKPFLVISGDALTDVDLTALTTAHEASGSQATLLLARVPNPLEYGVVVTEDDGRIVRFQEKPSWGEVLSDAANTGIYMLDPSVFDLIPAGREVDFSMDVFPAMLSGGRPLYGHIADGYWTDIGTLDAYRAANADLVSGRVRTYDGPTYRADAPTVDSTARVDPTVRMRGPVYVGRGSEVHAHAVINGPAVIGDNTLIAERAEISDAVISGNVVVGVGAKLEQCIVARHANLGRGVSIREDVVIGDRSTLADGSSVRPGVRIWPRKFVDEGVVVDRSLIHAPQARRTIFTHGGVAGLANFELTPEFAARLGAAWGSTLPVGSSIVANRDQTRPARMVKRALMAGLASVGVRVIDIGSTPFPVGRFSCARFEAEGAAHVRTSPYDAAAVDVRFTNPRGVDIRPTDQRKIEATFMREDFRRVGSESIAEITVASALEAYQEALLRVVANAEVTHRHVGVVVDYSDGTCGETLLSVLTRLGVRDTAVDASPVDVGSGGMAIQERLARLGRIVTAVGATFGAVVGPDGNRIWLVDEQGTPIDSLTVIALVLDGLRARGITGPLAVPFTVPNSLTAYASQLGFTPIRTQANVANMMQVSDRDQAVVAANGRNALAFPSLHPGPDAMATLVHLISAQAVNELSLSARVGALPGFTLAHREVPVAWERRAQLMRVLNSHPDRSDEGDTDGVVFGGGYERAVVVPDDDRPVFRVMAEGEGPVAAAALADEIERLVAGAAG